MNTNGPIVIIETDYEEAELLKEVVNSLDYKNPVVIISDPMAAMAELHNIEQPYMVLSAINMRPLSGFALREAVLSDDALSRKCVPYIFYSAHATEETRKQVFDLKAHGYFHDINDYNEMGDTLNAILRYWTMCSRVTA